MAIRSQRVLSSFLAGDKRRAEAGQTATICITLAPRDGVTPSDKPAVRIYLGTEAAQFRAERAFVWSVERVRDPARRYDIHLMKDFAGFERRLWLTGFTNYRFAIPELAGSRGRAIYNDADQIYLRDPAELFDLDMGTAGVLSINDRDTSVMLIDCERMADLWNNASARATGNRVLEKKMRDADLWADLDDGWNARDDEYLPGVSHLIHYTTIHTQPWRPTPHDYVYRANPASDIWMEIEKEADDSHFQLFSAAHPSPEFTHRRIADHVVAAPRPYRLRDFARLARDAHATTLLYCGADAPERLDALAGEGALGQTDIRCEALEAAVAENTAAGTSADIVAADGLAQLPDLDMPWVLDALFARAERALIVAVMLDERADRSTPADAHWWYAQMVAAGRRHPSRHWRLVVRSDRSLRAPKTQRWSGGALLRVPPSVWTLLHYKTGHASQAQGIAQALGWPAEPRRLRDAPVSQTLALLRARLNLGTRLLDNIHAPWPDVVIASGWLPAVAARCIQRANGGNTRLILLGRRGGRVGETQDIGVVCKHFDLPPNPRQIESVLPPNKVSVRELASAGERFANIYGDGPHPHVALLVGGKSAQHALDENSALAMMQAVQAQVSQAGGRLAVLTSRRTPGASARAIAASAQPGTHIEPWRADAGRSNPYLGYLAGADILIVTGESESMLAEAIATGKPTYIYPIGERAPGMRRRIADWVVGQAQTDRFNARGSRRPQQGLQYLCARLVDRRIFVPRRNMAALHQNLVEQGVARMLDGRLESWRPPTWHETEWLARRIRAWLPQAGRAGASAGTVRKKTDTVPHRTVNG